MINVQAVLHTISGRGAVCSVIVSAACAAGLAVASTAFRDQAPHPVIALHGDMGRVSGYKGLTHAQMLDRVQLLPGRRGFVRGITGTPAVRKIAGGTPSLELIVTDYPFTVHGFFGSGPSPYPMGSTITLRVPGGTLGSLTMVQEDGPTVSPGQELLVDVRDQGQIAGGNTATRQVASSAADVLELRNGIVRGRGAWHGFMEDEETFQRHFKP